jgi:tetratricopeptide (TPR) repeat protein
MKASNAAAVALANSPENGMALLIPAAMSMLVERDAETARSYYERARAAGVDQSFWAFSKAYLLDGPLGHYDEAIAELREAHKRDPLAPNVQWALVDMCVASGRIAEAVASAEALQELAATAPEAPVVSALAFLAAGDVQRARSMAAQLDNIELGVYHGSPFLKFVIDAATGDLVDARRVLDDLLQQSAGGLPVTFWSLGEGYKALGDFERALDSWERAAERREVYSLSRMPLDNRNHPVIGNHPRFLALLKRMGLESRQAAIEQRN